MAKVNYYTTDRKLIFKRLLYLSKNYQGVKIPPINTPILSLHDTKINNVRTVVLEYENRKEIFTLISRNYYGKVEES